MASLNNNIMYGSVDLLILKTLSFGEPRHGLAIAGEIHHISRDRLRVEGNALYPALHRLEEKGWIEGEWRISGKGRRARFYALTASGSKRLRKAMREWIKHTDAVRHVLEYAAGETS
jgi:transcriptional regulator